MTDPCQLVEFASDAAFAVTHDQRIVAWNEAAQSVLGYSASEVAGRHCRDVLQAILPGGEPLCTPSCQGSACFSRCQPLAVPACLARHRDGRWVRLRLSTLVVPDGAPSRRAGVTAAIVFLHGGEPAPAAASSPKSFRIHTFGRFRLVLDGCHFAVDRWHRRQALTLLKLLVTHRGTAVHRDRLIESLWPEVEEKRGRERLKVTVYALRRRIDSNGRQHDLIETVGDGYALKGETAWVDADAFERLVVAGTALERAEKWDEALRCYQDATAIYRGDYLEEDLYADWCAEERERLRETFFDVLARMATICFARGRHAEAAEACRRALFCEPCRENFHRMLMECMVALGRPEEAVAQFRRCRDVLARELDVEPLPETQALYRRIVDGGAATSQQTA